MNSLTIDPIAAVLRRLYQEAERTDRPLLEKYRDRGVALDELLKAEAKDYRAFYRTYTNNFLNVSADFGRFLYMCARARKAKRIVEFGTSFGVSTIHLACALRDGGGGHLIGSELEPTKARRARENLNDAGLAEFVEIRIGDALETLKDGIVGDVDLVFLDGAFSLYMPVLKLLEPYLRDGAFVISNALEGCVATLAGVTGSLIDRE